MVSDDFAYIERDWFQQRLLTARFGCTRHKMTDTSFPGDQLGAVQHI